MTYEIVQQNIAQLLDQWAEAERGGIEFPVPFDMAWPMAGYSTKANAKRAVRDLIKGKDFSSQMMKSGRAVRSSEVINFTLDGFKEFCLLARTSDGKAIRQYFIDAEKKWNAAKGLIPALSEKLEISRLENESLKIQLQLVKMQEARIGMHGLATTLLLEGKADSVVEIDRPVIEVIDARSNSSYKGMTLVQINEHLKKTTGKGFKDGAAIKRRLIQLGEQGLIAQTPRTITGDYVPLENLEAVYKALAAGNQQQLL